jgi:alpha-glucosidase
LRRAQPALIGGSIRFLDAQGGVLAFLREKDGERLLCLFNFAREDAAWPLPPDFGAVRMLYPAGSQAAVSGGAVSLPPLGAFVAAIG